MQLLLTNAGPHYWLGFGVTNDPQFILFGKLFSNGGTLLVDELSKNHGLAGQNEMNHPK